MDPLQLQRALDRTQVRPGRPSLQNPDGLRPDYEEGPPDPMGVWLINALDVISERLFSSLSSLQQRWMQPRNVVPLHAATPIAQDWQVDLTVHRTQVIESGEDMDIPA